jgi:integrase/recombinase XerD
MNSLAPALEAFFTSWLLNQRRASPHTIAAYRDTFRLLLGFAQARLGKPPAQLDLADLDAALIGAFLDHLERQRGNSIRSRNAGLAAVHSFFRFAALREPGHAALIQRVLAIPPKRCERALITFLTRPEIDALLAAPDRSGWTGRRDHALLLTAIQTGLRVSELTQLRCQDAELGTGAHLRCHGKGRKDRITPLTTQTAAVLRTWLRERDGTPLTRCFPPAAAGHSAGTQLSSCSPSTPALQHSTARRYATGNCRLTCYATPPPCSYVRPASTSPSARSGSVTRASKQPRSTCTPTSRSKNRPSPARPRRTQHRADTGHPTRCWRSWNNSDYAERLSRP